MKKSTKFIIFLCSIAITLQLLRIYLLDYFNPNDYEYSNLQNQIHQLKIDNNALYIELLTKEGYMTISKEAKERGFKSANYVYLR